MVGSEEVGMGHRGLLSSGSVLDHDSGGLTHTGKVFTL